MLHQYNLIPIYDIAIVYIYIHKAIVYQLPIILLKKLSLESFTIEQTTFRHFVTN
jgi:hypothetical protein